jgi:predicted choloylglycine hydrolase
VSSLRDTLARALRGRRGRPREPGGPPRAIPFTFVAIAEDQPADAFQARFDESWDAYRAWYLQAGDAARPSYVECRAAIRTHMPELLATYERVVELGGGGDLTARMLSLWCPPSYLSGCTQAVLFRPAPVLVRNYDYDLHRIEGAIVRTAYTGGGVIGMSDCLWGMLDGVNDAGFGVSLAFGGRPVTGEGFGVPLVLRYLLQVCETVQDAREVLARLPYQLAHTLTMADRSGGVLTAYLAPDREVEFREVAAATTHQGAVEWTEHAAATRSLEREHCMTAMLDDPAVTEQQFLEAFLKPPLRSGTYSKGFGTLYTAVYDLEAGSATYAWPDSSWKFAFGDFHEGARVERFHEVSAA